MALCLCSDVRNWLELAQHSAADTCTVMETPVESGEDGPVYTLPQIKAAWRLMCRGEKEGLRKRDIGTATRACSIMLPISWCSGTLQTCIIVLITNKYVFIMGQGMPPYQQMEAASSLCDIIVHSCRTHHSSLQALHLIQRV